MSTLAPARRLFEESPFRQSLARAATAGRPPLADEPIPIRVDETDLQRIRTALDRLATDEDIPESLDRAVTRLDISLQEPLFWIERSEQPMTIAFDAVDLSVIALAICHESNLDDERPADRSDQAGSERVCVQ